MEKRRTLWDYFDSKNLLEEIGIRNGWRLAGNFFGGFFLGWLLTRPVKKMNLRLPRGTEGDPVIFLGGARRAQKFRCLAYLKS